MKKSCVVKFRFQDGEIISISIPEDWEVGFVNKLKMLGYDIVN